MEYFTADGSPLPYNPHSTHGFTVEQLEACAKKQGVQFRQGDILILRVGFIQKYYALHQTQKDELSAKPEALYGLLVYILGDSQANASLKCWCRAVRKCETLPLVIQLIMNRRKYWLTLLRDNHFAAVASDQPAFEVNATFVVHEYH